MLPDRPAARHDAAVTDPRLPTALEEALLDIVAQIPRGRVSSYGEIAAIAGVGGPRQVAAALRRFGGGLPWWRVLRADGRAADEVAVEQLRRLADEGVSGPGGRIEMARYRWRAGEPLSEGSD
jgi:alkylated DNA nucleotide flippase Atl1